MLKNQLVPYCRHYGRSKEIQFSGELIYVQVSLVFQQDQTFHIHSIRRLDIIDMRDLLLIYVVSCEAKEVNKCKMV